MYQLSDFSNLRFIGELSPIVKCYLAYQSNGDKILIKKSNQFDLIKPILEKHSYLDELTIPVESFFIEQKSHYQRLNTAGYSRDFFTVATEAKKRGMKYQLSLALAICQLLKSLQRDGLIMGYLTAENLAFSDKDYSAKFLDLTAVSLFSKLSTPLKISFDNSLLMTIAPEATGRVNSPIEQPTDLYSLGCLLYFIFAQKFPFSGEDAMELVHCHIAKQPANLGENIPDVINEIIATLIHKSPESRYNNIDGVIVDLTHCFNKQENNKPLLPFELSVNLGKKSLVFSTKVYGRENEISDLLNQFDQISQEKTKSLCVIDGYSGVGKSSVIDVIQKPVLTKKALYLTGKFDQYKRDVAYYALLTAIKTLAENLLSQSENKVIFWRNFFAETLGSERAFLVELVPEFAPLFGELNTEHIKNNTIDQNRFKNMVLSLFRAMSAQSQTLVLFLDDLQWTDIATLDVVQALLLDIKVTNLLVIFSYRSNEVEQTHPLNNTLTYLSEKTSLAIKYISLQPLSEKPIESFLADTLNLSHEQTKDLAELVHLKTNGNPFFVKQFIQMLVETSLLQLNEKNCWCWNIEKIKQKKITENLVELVTHRFINLPSKSRYILKLASFVGAKIKVSQLCLLLSCTYDDLLSDIEPLITQGAMVAITSMQAAKVIEVAFSHDRIQQAAHQLSSEETDEQLHLFIAQSYLKHAVEIDNNLLKLIGHVNESSVVFIASYGRLRYIELNIQAGLKALNTNAYLNARVFFETAKSQLDKQDWEKDYQLSFDLYHGLIASLNLNNAYDEAISLSNKVMLMPIVNLDTMRILLLRMTAFFSQNKIYDAYQAAVEALKLAQIDVTHCENIGERYLSLKGLYDEDNIENIVNLPALGDEKMKLAVEILNKMMAAAYLVGPNEYLTAVFEIMSICLKFGNSSHAGIAYSVHGIIMSGLYQKYQEGYAFAELAIEVNNKYYHQYDEEVEYQRIITSAHWLYPLTNELDQLEQLTFKALEKGKIEYSGHCAMFYCYHIAFSGIPLDEVNQKFTKYINFLQNKQLYYHIELTSVLHQFIHNLFQQTQQSTKMCGPVFDEETQVPVLLETKNNTILFSFYNNKMILAYLLDDIEQASHYMALAEPIASVAMSLYHQTEFFFYSALVHSKLYKKANKKQKENHLAKIKGLQTQFSLWAKNSPDNHLHKSLLIDAELAFLENNEQAWQYYDLAIAQAKKTNFIQHLALIHEQVGEFWLTQNKTAFALTHFEEAYGGYSQWNAHTKTEQLLNKYPHLKDKINMQKQWFNESKGNNNSLDLSSVLKASEMLSGEGHLDAFLNKMLSIIVENSGAQQGSLFFKEANSLTLQVSLPKQKNIQQLPMSLINLVSRTRKIKVLDDKVETLNTAVDTYFDNHSPKSILIIPIIVSGNLSGVLYLEHFDISGIFSQERIKTLQLLANQTAIFFENNILYKQKIEDNRNLEDKVAERTKELTLAKFKAEEATEAKSNFLANMSHEIRTPMNAVIGLSRLTLRSNLERQQQDNLNKILDSSEALLGLINDILDFSKIEAGKMSIETTSFELAKVIQRATAVCNFKAHEKKLELINYIASDVPDFVLGDSLRLQQILTNLLSNAVKFSHDGIVSVEVIRLPTEQGLKLQVSVKDTGIGMTPEQQTKLFQLFAQADDSVTRKYGGTGLGLAICKQLSELMGGEIWVESVQGEGSTFTFTLMLEEDKTYQAGLVNVSKEDIANLRVLIVDDIELSRRVIVEALADINSKIDEAENGEQAVQRVQQAQKDNHPYDVVIMDWKMPVMDGITAASIIYQQGNSTPKILMVSAYDKGEAKNIAQQYTTNIEHYIEKPINQSELMDYLNSIVLNKPLAGEKEKASDNIPDLSNRHVLLVEDNPLNQQVAMGFLADTFVQVDIAENGQQALDMLERANQYELVFMDIQMPVMDGLTAAKIARNELNITIPIVAMTAHAMAGDSQKSIDAGMNHHITKPIDPNELYRVLSKYLACEKISEAKVKSVPALLKLKSKTSDSEFHLLKAFQTIKCLDFESALNLLGGKHELLENLIKGFSKNDTLEAQLSSALKQQDYTLISRIAHTLKASTAYLGYGQLSEVAENLETACKDIRDVKLIERLSDEMGASCTKLTDQIKRIISEEQRHSVPEDSTFAFTASSVLSIIEQLKPLIVEGNFAAEELVGKLASLCNTSSYKALADEIFELVSDFEFDDGLEKLIILEKELLFYRCAT